MPQDSHGASKHIKGDELSGMVVSFEPTSDARLGLAECPFEQSFKPGYFADQMAAQPR